MDDDASWDATDDPACGLLWLTMVKETDIKTLGIVGYKGWTYFNAAHFDEIFDEMNDAADEAT